MDAKTRERTRSCTSSCAQLDEYFADLLRDKTNSVFIAAAVGLRQYQLDRKYDAAFVLNEAYIRARNSIERGKRIDNFPGWIRLTSRYVIQELSRSERKKSKLLGGTTEEIPNPTSMGIPHEEITEAQQKMGKAFATLTPLEKDILQLKVVKELRWSQVQVALASAGWNTFSVNYLSQKKRRALKKLKKIYKELDKE